VKQHGRPVSVHTDKAGLFRIAPRASHHRYDPEQQLIQIGRALEELNIAWTEGTIRKPEPFSPQKKGAGSCPAPRGSRDAV
jgi:hypothetical protein